MKLLLAQGADGSFLLRSDNFPNNLSEKDSISQVGMRNSKYVGDIKLAVDAYCPGVISCADTLAVAGAAAVKVVSIYPSVLTITIAQHQLAFCIILILLILHSSNTYLPTIN